MDRVQKVSEDGEGISIADLAVVGGPGAKTGRVECFRIPEYYPAKPDNPCLRMSEGEFKAYIRKRREEFAPKWEAHLKERARQASLLITKEKR